MDIKNLQDKRQKLFASRPYTEFLSLNSIITELWIKKTGSVSFNSLDDEYKNFEKDTTKKFKQIFAALEIDITQYVVENGRRSEYRIPAIIAEYFYSLAAQDGKKGSFVSKIKTKQLDDITYSQIIAFIDLVADRLEQRFAGEYPALGDVRECRQLWKNSAAFLREVYLLQDQSAERIGLQLYTAFSAFGDFRYANIILPTDIYKTMEMFNKEADGESVDEDHEYISVPSDSEINQRVLPIHQLEPNESLYLLSQLNSFISEGIARWEQAVDNYLSIKDDVTTLMMESDQHEINVEQLWSEAVNGTATHPESYTVADMQALRECCQTPMKQIIP